MTDLCKIIEYKTAKIKFNNGLGAILCNTCERVIKTGWDHEDRAYYCSPACEPKKVESLDDDPNSYARFIANLRDSLMGGIPGIPAASAGGGGGGRRSWGVAPSVTPSMVFKLKKGKKA
jgi:hypothetical protein